MYLNDISPTPSRVDRIWAGADSIDADRRTLQVNGVLLDVAIAGPADGQALVMIPGLGMQWIDWPARLVLALVKAGFRVILFDPRDIGLSQDMGHLGRAHLPMAAFSRMLGMRPSTPYTLGELADDVVGLLDALGLASAHVCGMSMGGMIAQRLAIHHPQRVLSLSLMMTSSGSPWLPSANPLLMQRLAVRPPSRRDPAALLAHMVGMNRLIESPAWPEAEDITVARVRAGLARSYRPHAVQRQATAVMADGDRTALLRKLRVPTQIIHGLADPLVPAAAAKDLAKQIPDARLDLIEGMVHDLPEALWPRFVQAIRCVADQANLVTLCA
jgi:pimeloyl-ACP methyl ester carboxylesterase